MKVPEVAVNARRTEELYSKGISQRGRPEIESRELSMRDP